MNFTEFRLSNDVLDSITKLGFDSPTQIQEKSIPPILEGKDVLGESATGSGKTLAFGCGIIEHAKPKHGIQALVLTPTRELAEQVRSTLRELAHHKRLKVTSIYGGVAIGPQIDALERAEVVIATPGRLKDHLERRTIDLRGLKTLVLDEADRMLDMGFIEDIEEIMQACPEKRQTLFFSATIPHEIDHLSKRYLNHPIKVSAVKHVDPKKLKQEYYDIPRGIKISLAIHLLKEETSSRIMIFCNTRRSTDFLVKNLKANNLDAVGLHGGFTQNKRNKAIELFKNGKVNILVCTDVAARGIHIDNISHIYNYEIPGDAANYVHRIGRTARAGEEGKVINLLCDIDYENFSKIMHDYDFNIEKKEAPRVERVIVKREEQSRGRFGGRGGSRGFGRGRSDGPRSSGPRHSGPRRSGSRGGSGRSRFGRR